jgi:protein O-mannosyl-transferase
MTDHDSSSGRPLAGEKALPPEGSKSGRVPKTPVPVRAGAVPESEWMPLLCLLLAAAVLWTFWPVINNDFVNYDDGVYVTENVHVQSGLMPAGVRWALGSTTASNWHPLTWLSHMLDCQLYGLQPWGHHLTSVLLHTANTLLLFVVLRRMTKATWQSLSVAALFGLHPLHVQSVAWVAERKDVLSTLFWILAVGAYVRYAQGRNTSNIEHPTSNTPLCYWTAVFFFALGLMAKPMVVTLPLVMLLLDYWPLERWKRERAGALVLEKAPLFLIAAMASGVTFMAQKSGGAVGTVAGVPVWIRLENALVSYGRYLGKMFRPVDLAVLYPHPGRWPTGEVVLSGLLLLGITVLVVALRRQRPWLPVGWFWFVGTLVPVIGLVQVGEQSMADRYTYVPLLGMFILLTWELCAWTRRWPYRKEILIAVAAAAVVPCILITRQQIGYWTDSETLFRRAIAVEGDSFTADYKLGIALCQKGRFDEAIGRFQTALKLRPDDLNVHYGLGMAWAGKGRLDEAIAAFQEVIRRKPDYAEAHNNLGFVLSRQGRLDEAISQYHEALRLQPDNVNVRLNLGVALGRQGLLDEAIVQFQEALKLAPDNVGALYDLGLALDGQGRRDEAIRRFQEVLRLDPNNAGARSNLDALLRKREGMEKDRLPGTRP